MRTLAKKEKIIFCFFSVALMLPEIYWLIMYLNHIEYGLSIVRLICHVLEMMFSIQLILLFVKRCPKVLYIAVSAMFVIYCLYEIYEYIALIVEQGIETELLLIVNEMIIAAACSCLLVVIKLKPNRIIAIIAAALWLVKAISYFGRMIYDHVVYIDYYSLDVSDAFSFMWRIGSIVGFALMLVVVCNIRRCQCGYFYKKGAKFCGKCGKAI